MTRLVKISILFFLIPVGFAQGETPCEFDRDLLSFVGDSVEQGRCLLRDVGQWAVLGPIHEELPAPLESFIGQDVEISREQLKEYLRTRGIDEGDLGGPIEHELSRAKSGDPDAVQARYLVIHDTSTPNYKELEFPGDVNEETWKHNDLSTWDRGNKSRAHVFVNRVGDSMSPVHFSRPWRATKFELQYGNTDPKGLFLHVELVQPRRSANPGFPGNDAVAPDPGFTDAQYTRLALLYVAAGVRKGEWLVPVYHAVLDAGKEDGHDDPQRFSLSTWADKLQELVDVISAQ